MSEEVKMQFSNLNDPYSCSKEELLKEIEHLDNLVGFYETKQLAIKKFINSVYGATGSKYYVAYNPDMAESITAQGQDLNHFSENSVNAYFSGIFQSDPELILYYQWTHTDKDGNKYTFDSKDKPDDYYNSGNWEECKVWAGAVKKGKKFDSTDKSLLLNNHIGKYDWLQTKTTLCKKLGIDPEKAKHYDISKGKTTDTGELLGKDFEYLNGTQSLTVAGDTDSIYVEFGRLTKYFEIPFEKQTKFVVDLWNYSVGPYMENKYEEYAKKFNCDENIQKLELEKIADTTVLFAKKRYAMAECWKEPDIYLKPMDKIVYKGIEIVKGSTSSFARECMKDFTNFILSWYQKHDERVSYDAIMTKLSEYKTKFMMMPEEEISNGVTVGGYEKFILKDKGELAVELHCPAHVKAAGVHNLLLNKPSNKKYRVKYNMIKTNDKVKWYYTKDKTYEVFAFLPGDFPREYALPIDRDVQFEKTILSFCNKIIEILGYNTLTSSLCYTPALF